MKKLTLEEELNLIADEAEAVGMLEDAADFRAMAKAAARGEDVGVTVIFDDKDGCY